MACELTVRDLISLLHDSGEELTKSQRMVIMKQSSTAEFWLPDENDLDIMHHAILAGNEDAVNLLHNILADSVDDETVESKQAVGYMHLAALLGNANIMGILCEGPFAVITEPIADCKTQFRFDVIKQYLTKNNFQRTSAGQSSDLIEIAKQVLEPQLDELPKNVIDIAAMAGHVECVKVILKSSVVHYAVKRFTLLERALDLGSIKAFCLLLTLKPEETEVHSAFQFALTSKKVDFVAALLDYGVDTASALKGINPYHCIYLCSPPYNQSGVNAPDRRQSNGIDTLTALLIERGFDVNACDPPGTFPLYSLLASLIMEKDYNPKSVPVGHIRCLELLLRAGAKTDINELQHAQAQCVSASTLTAESGRELASSALNAYFIGLQASDTWRPHIVEHLDRICLTLLEHGSDPSAVHSVTVSTPLHDLMHAAATQHAVGHMHADMLTMSRMLLYFGADPNATNAAGQYPIEVYFHSLLQLMGGLIAFRRWKSSDNARQVLHIMYFMDAGDACTSRHRIVQMLMNAHVDGMPSDVVQFVADLMDIYVCTTKSLQELVKLVLWKSVRRRMSAVQQLNMPRVFKSGIADLFSLYL